MDISKNNAKGSAEILGGGYIAYQGINHGLPRALGIRIEYHTTTKDNARKIKESGGYLDPKFGGGETGWSKRVNSRHFLDNSKDYVHITGTNKNSKIPKKVPKQLSGLYRTVSRQINCALYKTVGNTEVEEFKSCKEFNPKYVLMLLKGNLTPFNNTERLCVGGIDSYFDDNFIPDTDSCAALKTKQKVKVSTSRPGAMIDGLKKFGLKGMKENKARVALGGALCGGGIYLGKKLIDKGRLNIKENQ